MNETVHAPVLDRVRANTWAEVNDRIDRATQLRLRTTLADESSAELDERIDELDREWDFERVLEAEASLMGLLGVALGAGVHRRFLLLPGFVASMLIVHANHGWYPLLPLFRRLGVRTRDEIDRERYALKAARGDFAAIPPAGSDAATRAAAAWEAVCL